MNVQIQSVKFDADKRLLDFIESKFSKLDRFVERATSAKVILKVDKDNERGNKVVTMKIEVPGEELIVAEHRAKTFEEAIDTSMEALKKQIEKYKEKIS